MSFNLLDIFCLTTIVMLPMIALKMPGYLRRLDPAGPRHHKWSLWLSFIGLFLSIIFVSAANFWPLQRLFEIMLGLYGLSFYALIYHFNPFLRVKLAMPWKTSVRLYLLAFLIGVTTHKLGGPRMSVYYFAISCALGALVWSRYSIVQTIVMIVQLVLTLVVIYLIQEATSIWLAILGAVGNVTIFMLDSKLRESK